MTSGAVTSEMLAGYTESAPEPGRRPRRDRPPG